MLRTDRLQPPVRRVLAVDAGSRCLRLALVKSSFGQVEILREESFDLHDEGLVATDELKTHLLAIRSECGDPPIALTLAQHLSISQTIELPQAPESEIHKLIEDETVKLTGVSDSAIVHDFVTVDGPVATGRQQFWVTFCKEGDIEDRIRQLGLDQDDLCEVTTTASGLAVAYRAAAPEISQAILVHLGAQSTVVVVLHHSQAVFAASFPVGGDFFARAIAKARRCSVEEAESLRRNQNLLAGDTAVPEFAEFVDGWSAELKRQINDCFTHLRDKADVTTFALIASGSVFGQPGLLEYLKTRVNLTFRPWPAMGRLPSPGFEIAYGTALQALGLARSVSLLPPARRNAWRRRLTTQTIEFANVALLVLCFLALGFGLWQKFAVLKRKEMLLAKAEAALDSLQSNQALTSDLVTEYERLRPLLEHQQNTADTLETLALLQQSRSNRSFWYVLMADQQSYFSAVVTNRVAGTNTPTASASRPPFFSGDFLFGSTNFTPVKPGLIAELCVPEDAEGARRVLSQVVNILKERPLFNKVDLLSDDLRRNLADPKVILPERHFALSLDFAATELQAAASGRRSRMQDGGGSGRSLRRPTSEESETGP